MGSDFVDNGDNTGASLTLQENTGGIIARISSSVDSSASPFTYSLDSTSETAGFSIDANTGEITAPVLDFENQPAEFSSNSLTLTVNIVGGGTEIYSEDLEVTLLDTVSDIVFSSGDAVVDFVDNGDGTGASLSLEEGGIARVIASVSSIITDSTFNTFTYTLDANSLAAGFSIDANTGEITAPVLDFEDLPAEFSDDDITLTVTAMNGGTEIYSEDIAFTLLNIASDIAFSSGDVGIGFLDNGNSTGASLSLLEGTGGIIARISSLVDFLATSYSLDAAAITAGFTINATTGEITAPALDFEDQPAGLSNNKIVLTVVAQSLLGTYSENITVTLVNITRSIAFTSGAVGSTFVDNGDSTGASLSLQENIGGVIAQASSVGDFVSPSYSLDSTSITAGFSINATTGEITAPVLDFENQPTGFASNSLTLTVTATGTNSGEVFSEDLVVTLLDIASDITFSLGDVGSDFVDNGDGTGATLDLEENSTGVIARVDSLVVDSVSTTFTYSLDAVSLAAGFSINSATGEITAPVLDFENQPAGFASDSLTLTVTVLESGSEVYTEDIDVTLLDVTSSIAFSSGDVGTSFVDNGDGTGATLDLQENSAGVIARVGSLVADSSSAVTYSLDSVSEAAGFSIDSATGAITAPSFDYDNQPSQFSSDSIDLTVSLVADGSEFYSEDIGVTLIPQTSPDYFFDDFSSDTSGDYTFFSNTDFGTGSFSMAGNQLSISSSGMAGDTGGVYRSVGNLEEKSWEITVDIASYFSVNDGGTFYIALDNDVNIDSQSLQFSFSQTEFIGADSILITHPFGGSFVQF